MAMRCGVVSLALLLTANAACRGPCTPPPSCRTPRHPLANAEADEELGGHARWSAKVDRVGSKLAEPASAPFAVEGANGTQRAARVSGTFASSGDAFAVLELELDRDATAALASPAFGSRPIGLSFWAKSASASGSLLKARFTVTCGDADSFALDLPVYEAWSEFQIPFTALKPLPTNRASTLDPTRIQRFEWRSTEPGQRFDLAVDELVAIACIQRDVPTYCHVK